MKKFVLQLLWFVLPVVLLAYPADRFISKNLRDSNNFAANEYPVWNAIFENDAKASLFIYGSSRAWRHIDPKIITDSLHMSAYNFGIDGHNFKMQGFRHQLLIRQQTPKVIIHSLDMTTLIAQDDLYNANQFLPYLLYNDVLRPQLMKYSGLRVVDFNWPMFRYFGNYLAVKEACGQFLGLDANGLVRKNGFQAFDGRWDGKFEKIKSKLTALYVRPDAKIMADFDRYLKDCRQKDIRIVFVYSPEYIEGQRFEINRAQIMSLYKNFAEQYAIPFLDYSNDPMCGDKKYFYNAMHLNKTGTNLFNSKLLQDLRGLNILDKP